MFNDSLNFVMSSLDALVKGSDQEDLKIAEKRKYEYSQKRKRLLKKGINPYEYINGLERLAETDLPAKEEFYWKLEGKGIADEGYAHAIEERLDRLRVPNAWVLQRPVLANRRNATE